jgi:hypothetical protein
MLNLVPRLATTLVLLVMLAPAAVPCARADSALRLNEILAGPSRDWDGSGTFSSRDDEWVEIVNGGAVPVDLAACIVTDGDRIPRCALSGTLGPGSHRVLFGSESYAWEKAHGFPAFGLSLANGGDAVMLWQVSGAETLLVDSYTYASHEAASDRAIGRAPDAAGGWALFDGLNPYAGTTPPAGTGCAPTPGAVNVCTLTPALPTTWGRLKTLYR